MKHIKTELTCQKLWGGRFTENIDPDFHNFNMSIHIDKRLYAEDIQVNIIEIYMKYEFKK